MFVLRTGRDVYTGSTERNVCLGLGFPTKPLYCVVCFESLCSLNFVRCLSYVRSFAEGFILCSVCVFPERPFHVYLYSVTSLVLSCLKAILVISVILGSMVAQYAAGLPLSFRAPS